MGTDKPRILFMGTPEFAVPSLELLVEKAWPVIGVVTQPDRPKGRGQRLVASPVKEAAVRHGLTVYQPEKVRAPEFLEIFRGLAPDMVVLVAFGQILPKDIIDGPPMGCVNVHPSLLPKYRGAAPMNWALIRGEKKTGISIMKMDEGVDSGDILLQEETAIEPGETYDHLHNRLAILGAQCLLRTLEGLACGDVHRIPQDHALATLAPRLKKEGGLIRWESPARDIAHFVAGLSSVPGAHTLLDGKVLKVYSAEAEEAPMCCETPGTIVGPAPKGLKIAAGGGYVYLKDVQLESKKRLLIIDFLRGFRFTPGSRLG
jgi:methionyl-tRNA formyltransferase